MKLKWEIPNGIEDSDIHVLYLYNDVPEAMESKDLIAAVIRKSKKKWVLAIEGRKSKNKIVEAKNFDEAESLLEHHNRYLLKFLHKFLLYESNLRFGLP